MAQFPASDDDELVTRSFLRAEIADLRTALRAEIGDVRTETADLRTEIHRVANRTLVATTGMVVAGMGVAAAVGSALGS